MVTDGPERIWAEETGHFMRGKDYYNGGKWSDDPESGMTPYIRLDVHEAAVAAARAEVEALRMALIEIDALDPEHLIDGCAPTALRGLVLRMGEIARAALAAEAKP